MIFTRLLYCLDEVKINLLISILKKEDFKEVVFWLVEIYESGYKDDLIQYLWQIYYDFYAIETNFSQLKYLNDIRKYKKTNHFIFLMNFAYNLYQSNYSFDIFMIRMLYDDKENVNIKKETYEKLLHLLYEKKTPYVFYKFLKLGLNNYTKKDLIKMVEKIKNEKSEKKVKYKENNQYNNLYHMLLVYLFNKQVKKRTSCKKLNKKIIDYYQQISQFDKKIKQTNILNEYRHYEISSLTSCFILDRDTLKQSLTKCFWYHWEYFAYKCPWWKKKFNEYNININDETKSIEFKDDDEYETFTEKNSYDLDELPLETRNKSTKHLNSDLSIEDLLIQINDSLKLKLNLSRKINIKKNKY